jgi:hypothetical protein
MICTAHPVLCGRGEIYGVSVGKPEGKRTFGRHRRVREDYIKTDFQEMGCGLNRAGSG